MHCEVLSVASFLVASSKFLFPCGIPAVFVAVLHICYVPLRLPQSWLSSLSWLPSGHTSRDQMTSPVVAVDPAGVDQ